MRGVERCIAIFLLIHPSNFVMRGKFYEHVLGFEVVAPPQFYPPGDVPVVLLSRLVDSALERRIRNNAFFKTRDEELAEVRAQIASLLGERLF